MTVWNPGLFLFTYFGLVRRMHGLFWVMVECKQKKKKNTALGSSTTTKKSKNMHNKGNKQTTRNNHHSTTTKQCRLVQSVVSVECLCPGNREMACLGLYSRSNPTPKGKKLPAVTGKSPRRSFRCNQKCCCKPVGSWLQQTNSLAPFLLIFLV